VTSLILEQLVNGIVLGAILCLVSIGLSLILGLMRVVNLAHGAMFVIGAYLGISVFGVTQNFLLAVIASFVGGVLVALVIEVAFVRFVYEDPDASLILSFGLLLAMTETVKLIWGPAPRLPRIPKELFGFVTIGPVVLPIYRIVVAVAGVSILAGIWLFWYKNLINPKSNFCTCRWCGGVSRAPRGSNVWYKP
jgi:branched-subunit amino acid ABC-type transport system permease component